MLHFILLLQLLLQFSDTARLQDTAFFNQPFTLQQSGTIVLTDSTAQEPGKLVLQLANVDDSRCPADVMCIQAGQADVTFNLSTLENGETTAFTLSLMGKYRATNLTPINLAGSRYKITVLDVAPYPVATEALLLKHVKLVVTRL